MIPHNDPSWASMEMDRRFKLTYRLIERFGTWLHCYDVVCAKGGVTLHLTHNLKAEHPFPKWHGGLEVHHAFPIKDCPPDHPQCSVINRPCWHDGTSLWVEESFIPGWKPGDHESAWRACMRWAVDRGLTLEKKQEVEA